MHRIGLIGSHVPRVPHFSLLSVSHRRSSGPRLLCSNYRVVVPEEPSRSESFITNTLNLFASPLHLLGFGFITVEPNHIVVSTQFGKYLGNKYTSGLNWTPTPFGFSGIAVFMGERTSSMQNLKIIDKTGNPLTVSGIMNYHVSNPEQYCFGVDNQNDYIYNQAESALKSVVSQFTYDELRSHNLQLESSLMLDVGERLEVTGVVISEFKLTDINYAKEIAQAMLVKQQALAYNDAKKEIVRASSDIVNELANQYKDMDPHIRDMMIKDLMVVITSGSSVQPVINV